MAGSEEEWPPALRGVDTTVDAMKLGLAVLWWVVLLHSSWPRTEEAYSIRVVNYVARLGMLTHQMAGGLKGCAEIPRPSKPLTVVLFLKPSQGRFPTAQALCPLRNHLHVICTN